MIFQAYDLELFSIADNFSEAIYERFLRPDCGTALTVGNLEDSL